LGSEKKDLLFDSVNSVFLYPSNELIFTLDSDLQFTEELGPENAPIATSIYSLEQEMTTVTVPAGTFDCLNYKGTTQSLEPDYPYGTRTNSNLYADGIGLVLLQTQFYNAPENLEMRLLRTGRN